MRIRITKVVMIVMGLVALSVHTNRGIGAENREPADLTPQTVCPVDENDIDKNCPASRILAERLEEFGYTCVIEAPEGIYGWADVLEYPVEKQER